MSHIVYLSCNTLKLHGSDSIMTRGTICYLKAGNNILVYCLTYLSFSLSVWPTHFSLKVWLWKSYTQSMLCAVLKGNDKKDE